MLPIFKILQYSTIIQVCLFSTNKLGGILDSIHVLIPKYYYFLQCIIVIRDILITIVEYTNDYYRAPEVGRLYLYRKK